MAKRRRSKGPQISAKKYHETLKALSDGMAGGKLSMDLLKNTQGSGAGFVDSMGNDLGGGGQGHMPTVSAGGIEARPVRMRDFTGDPRVSTERSPYAGTIIRKGAPTDFGFMVGQYEATWDRIKEMDGEEINWFVDVIIDLSEDKMNRSVGIFLLSPDVVAPDSDARSIAAHLEMMQERKAKFSRLVASWTYIFAEKADRFNGKHLKKSSTDNNMSVDGLVRLLREIRTMAGKGFQVEGNPIFRIGFASAAGLVMRGHHLDEDIPYGLLVSWLYDIIEFTEGVGREYMWNKLQGKFVQVTRDQRRQMKGLNNLTRSYYGLDVRQ